MFRLALVDDEERPFLIDEALHFTARPSSAEDSDVPSTSFTWLDRSGDLEDAYLFVCDPSAPDVVAGFTAAIHAACYERKKNRPASEATQAELDQFDYKECVSCPDSDLLSSIFCLVARLQRYYLSLRQSAPLSTRTS